MCQNIDQLCHENIKYLFNDKHIYFCGVCDNNDPCVLLQRQDINPIHCPHDSGYKPEWEEVK